MPQGTESKKPAAIFIALGVIGCAICCSVPLLVGLGVGGAALTAIGVWAETAGLAFLGLGVVAAGLVFWRRRQRHSASCSMDCACRHRAHL